MEIIDISWPIEQSMTEYKNNISLNIKPIKTISRDGSQTTNICMNSHTGTHIDAPSHFLKDGLTIDQIEIASLVGSCYIIDCTEVSDSISKKHLESYPLSGKIVLLKTKNSFLSTTEPFNYNFIYLDKLGAEYLKHQNVKAVGIDYIGIERNQSNHETHTILLKNNIVIIEGLRLAHVSQGHYFLWCLPLLIKGIDGAPARAILVKE